MPLTSREKINRIGEAALIALFLIAVWLPLLEMIRTRRASQSTEEKRRLVQLPSLSFDRRSLAAFPGSFNAYFHDNFGGRTTLIRWQSIAKVKWLGVSTSPKVIVGKDGWLFYAGEEGLESYFSRPPFTPAQLKRWREVLQARRDWLAARGIRYLLVFAPEKQSIYPEYLPDTLRHVRRDARLDQLIADLKEHTDITVIDTRPALLEAKRGHLVFLKKDTHWNGYGGFAVYRSIVAELARIFPGMTPLQESDTKPFVADDTHGDLGRMLGLDGVFHEDFLGLGPSAPAYTFQGRSGDFNQPVITERKESDLPRLLMIRDSFTDAILPFLSQHFSRAVYVLDWSHRLQREVVKTERPDIVIQESVERFLPDDPFEDPPENVASPPPRQ